MEYEQLSKFFAGELTSEEKETFWTSLDADNELLEKAAQLKNSWATAQLVSAPGDKKTALKAWRKINANINRDKYFILPRWRVAVAAAMVGIIFAASLFFAGREKPATAYHTLTVLTGQYAQLTLADGSEVWLNSRSKVVYPERFTSATREIQLEGEALFKVKSDSKHPFIVKTETVNVIATGTQFNISAYPDDKSVAVSLIEGVVKLYSVDNEIDCEVKPGQIAVYDKLKKNISSQNTDTDIQISWIHGEYRFREMALEDIAKRLERIYGVVFVFHDETLKQRKFTGIFDKRQSIETILRVIEVSAKTQYLIENDTVHFK